MAIAIKTPDEIERMRIAGRLAAEVLDYIAPWVVPGASTEELDARCHEYMTRVQGTIPAPLNTSRIRSRFALRSTMSSATASRVPTNGSRGATS